MLVAHPTNKRSLVLANRLDAPQFGCSLHLSGTAGRTWWSVNPVPQLPAGADFCYAPEVAFDGDGRLYFLFVGLRKQGNTPMGVFLATSADGGRTFTRPRRVLGPDRFQVRMAIEATSGSRRGRLHLVWLEATAGPALGGFRPGPNPIMAAYSDDGGQRFSAPVQVSDPERERVVAPAVALGPHGRVHVLYYDLLDDTVDYQGLEGPVWEGNWALVMASSTDGGRRFRRGVVIDDDLVPPERVMLIFTMPPPALVADDGNLYAAWHDARNGDWDVFLRRSTDGGQSWEKPRRVNDDPLRNGRHQYLPRLSVAPDGRVDAVFYDRRRDPSNRGNDVYYTFSTDDGRRFERSVPLTSQGSDSQIGPRYAVPSALRLFEFGGRIALVSQRSHVVAAWTDTRNTNRAPPSQDIFATQVDLRREGDRSGPVRLGGALLAAAGLAALVIEGRAWRRGRAGRTARPARRRDGPSG
ncbi:MAG: glycoside hydrolase [Actinomycetota bacterium]|nr:glycoside hydrolase [Actinomycetota bacterium]